MIRSNFKNISIQSAAQLIPKAVMFIFIMYLAKSLGSIEYGKYEFALSAGYLIGIFFELGGNMILTKHVARSFYSSIYYALKIRIVSIFIALLLFYSSLFVFSLYADVVKYIIYASAGIAFSSMMNLFFAFFRGTGEMKYEAIVLIVQKLIFVILALVLMMYGKDASSVLIAFMISMLTGLILIYYIFRRKEKLYLVKNTRISIRFMDYMKDVFSLAMVEIFASLYFRLNQIFIEYYHGFSEVSTYGVAYRIIEVFINVPSILLLALFPVYARLASEDLSKFRMQFDAVLKILIILGLATAVFSWFAGEYIFNLLGNEYSNSYIILRYLSFPLVFLFPNYLITQGLIALNQNIVFARILFAVLLLNIILSFILVPYYGAIGSAVSIGICELVIFVSGLFYVRKYSVATQ